MDTRDLEISNFNKKKMLKNHIEKHFFNLNEGSKLQQEKDQVKEALKEDN